MSRRSLTICVGAGMWVSFIAFIVLISFLRSDLTQGYRLQASFGQLGGLKTGAGVYVSGIRIGKVITRSLGDNYRPLVTFSVRDSIPLPDDSSASIQTDGLFGSQFITLEPGGNETFLGDGDMVTFTESAIPLSRLLDLIIERGVRTRKIDMKKDAL